mmetsp:Transcript_14392/g.30795  ORF Transcript_14392/g.30795 Transcript_14392/m.30795 type:complete len:173 (-) Transcript_14392:283-801(-)
MAVKQGFYGRDKYITLKEAVDNRPVDIKLAKASMLKRLKSPGINIYKQVELYAKYHHIVPEKFWVNELYRKPPPNILAAVKKENKSRKVFREELLCNHIVALCLSGMTVVSRMILAWSKYGWIRLDVFFVLAWFYRTVPSNSERVGRHHVTLMKGCARYSCAGDRAVLVVIG